MKTSESGSSTKLSDREREILFLAADGCTDKEIASTLGVAIGTVGTYWERLRTKLQAANRSEAIAKALAESFRGTLAELEEAHEWTQLLIANATEYAIFMTNQKGVILDWNVGVARVLGYAEDEFVGQDISILFIEGDLAVNAPDVERRRALEHGRSLDDRWHHAKDGTQLWIEGVLICLRNANGTIRFAKIMRDGTQTRQLKEELDILRLKVQELATG
ncbi:MAG: hypothetical protein QOJ65_2825 [Fimbriimonadaceae bacterium]|jgi:PAS domain S-box-containing protein|nr:hypothetical protein [Fimbriimonadaceae bacterium]